MTNTTMQAHGLTVPEPVSGQRSNRHAAAAVAALATALAWSAPAAADSDEYFRPVTDETVKTECSACHMAYPAGMLPARSWRALMGDLSNHFGEDASLPEETRAAIEAWLTANAASDGSRIGRSMRDGDPVLRISETPWWVRAHRGEVSPAAFDSPKVGSKANCSACHRGAEQGYFEDD